jgi:hypothetical protein
VPVRHQFFRIEWAREQDLTTELERRIRAAKQASSASLFETARVVGMTADRDEVLVLVEFSM